MSNDKAKPGPASKPPAQTTAKPGPNLATTPPAPVSGGAQKPPGPITPAISAPPAPLFRKTDWLTFLVTTVIVFIGYWLTLAPELTLPGGERLADKLAGLGSGQAVNRAAEPLVTPQPR